jgi:hypothetical protein
MCSSSPAADHICDDYINDTSVVETVRYYVRGIFE